MSLCYDGLRFCATLRGSLPMATPNHGMTMTLERWTKGYTQSELDTAQQKFGLVFPPDLVSLLRDRRPLDGHDWTDEVAIRRMLDWPFEGLLFDVEHNVLWWPEWGEKPASPDARKEVLRSVVAHAPKLIPLIGHRYLPEEPHEGGNPVFSVYQSDVIYYGANLTDYFEREFTGGDYRPRLDQMKRIRFWSDLVERA
jgi:hypothetical protein